MRINAGLMQRDTEAGGQHELLWPATGFTVAGGPMTLAPPAGYRVMSRRAKST